MVSRDHVRPRLAAPSSSGGVPESSTLALALHTLSRGGTIRNPRQADVFFVPRQTLTSPDRSASKICCASAGFLTGAHSPPRLGLRGIA